MRTLHATDIARRPGHGAAPSRLLLAREGGPRPAAHAPPAAGHDFSRIPVHPGPSARVFPRLAASTPGDASEREAERVADEVTRADPARGEGGGVGCGGA